MRIMVLKKRQDHDTSLPRAAAFGAVVALAALTAAAPAQSVNAQGAVPCTQLADDAERLACYDRALRATPATSAPAEAAAVPAAAVPATQADSTATATVPAAEPSRQPRQVREATAPAAPAPPAPPAATSDTSNTSENPIIPIVIVGTRALPGRETTFILADGTSWVQNDSQRITGLPDTPFEAELKPGAVGSYFLVPKERGRAIRVRPIR
jgi:hypothetical protein